MIFRKTAGYSRAGSFDAARHAQAKGKVKKAITEYKKILVADPGDQDALVRIAPLLARTGESARAWQSFQAAAERYLDLGFFNKAAGVYAQAARCMPRHAFIWERLSELYLTKGHKADAVDALFTGHRNFTRKKDRAHGVKMLRKAFEIAPWSFKTTHALAMLLKKTGKKDEAFALLQGLAEREEGEERKKALKAAFRVKPGFMTAWRWLRAGKGK